MVIWTQVDPMHEIFPKMTKCDFFTHSSIGQVDVSDLDLRIWSTGDKTLPSEIWRHVPSPAEHCEREGFPRSLVLVHHPHHLQCPCYRVQVFQKWGVATAKSMINNGSGWLLFVMILLRICKLCVAASTMLPTVPLLPKLTMLTSLILRKPWTIPGSIEANSKTSLY